MKRFSCEHTLDLPTLGHEIIKAQSTNLTASGLKIRKKRDPNSEIVLGQKTGFVILTGTVRDKKRSRYLAEK